MNIKKLIYAINIIPYFRAPSERNTEQQIGNRFLQLHCLCRDGAVSLGTRRGPVSSEVTQILQVTFPNINLNRNYPAVHKKRNIKHRFNL